MKEKIIESILDPLILHILKNNSLNRNQIVREINEQFGTRVKPATIRKALVRLGGNKILMQKERAYSLTQQGKKTERQIKKDYFSLQKSVEQLLKD